jgi:hypothetical protein
MKTKRTRAYRSDALAAVHESMEALHRISAISYQLSDHAGI